MSSYPQPAQHPSTTNVLNGIPPQMQQQTDQQQSVSQGLNKFLPPTSQYLPTQTLNNNPIQQQMYQSAMRPNPVLINGGGSAQSSRTASPAMNNSFNQTVTKSNVPSTGNIYGQASNHSPHIPPSMSKMTGSMQNLSLGPSIANSALPPSPPTSNVNQYQKPTPNYPMNFKASPINSTPSISSGQSENFGQQKPPQMNINGPQNPGITSGPPKNLYAPVGGGYPNIPPTSTQNVLSPPQNNCENMFPSANVQPSKNHQHTVNNNQMQQSTTYPPQLPQHQHMQGTRKPMYPATATRTQQPDQPYSQAYQTQQQQRYQQSTFNGQTNNAPLQYQQNPSQVNYNQMNITQQGFNRLWGQDTLDLMQHRHILPHEKIKPPKVMLSNQFLESVNCNPDIMRCTLTKIPESSNLLQKSRLPLGIVVHPFRDINSLPVIQCPNIVRCRLCRTYINPFVYFVDSKMWKCNLCYRVNELPDDFQFDPATKTYGDVTRRPEVRSSTIEFIAPSEYMLRPPQPAIYLFLFDVSILAQQSGYLETVCNMILKHLDDMPGDARTQVGFIAFNSEIHFYNIAEGYNQPHEMTLVDIDDPFLPCPDNLLVNLHECKELIKDLLNQLPKRFTNTHDPGSALGAALQVAYKLMSSSGGRVTVFQTCLPNKGPGALHPREDPNNRSAKEVLHLNPSIDFYKRHALECSGNQIAVDLFLLNQQYSDLATICGVSKYSGGSIYHFPLYQKTKPQHVDALKQCLKRYLTRKIGFEAVMRIRCTRGLQVHTFHGNFFVRSTDLLSLPNVNPDAAYGMQISYEESLTDIKTISFQAALLYTNSEGERRIRVHTLCLPVTANLSDVMHSADTQSIVSLLGKMAVDRSLATSVSDARDAFINATIDIFSAFRIAQNLPQGQTGQLMSPRNLSLLPLYISALLKHCAFRTGTSTRLDDRVAAMDAMKTLPLDQLMKFIYPEFYLIDCLFYNLQNSNETEDDDQQDPPLLQLTAEYLDSRSIFLMDCGTIIIIYVGLNVPQNILENVLGVQTTAEIPDYCYGLPSINSHENDILKNFINSLNEDKPYLPTIQIIRDTSTCKSTFIEKLIDDRSECSLSYYEFLQHLRTQVK